MKDKCNMESINEYIFYSIDSRAVIAEQMAYTQLLMDRVLLVGEGVAS